MFAFLTIDEDGDEAVPAVRVPGGWMPLVAADEARLAALRPLAEQMAEQAGVELTLSRFEVRTDVETIRPVGGR